MSADVLDEIKAALTEICVLVRTVEKDAYNAHQLSWEIYGALVDSKQHLPDFDKSYSKARDRFADSGIIKNHDSTIQRLDELIALIQRFSDQDEDDG
jgi:hypothetical protein